MLRRLFNPRSIAVVGGGAWCGAIIEQCRKIGFDGDIWPVHPHAETLAGLPVFGSVADLPSAPDACFLGINRHASIEVMAQLSAMGAGGVVCFASGFQEAQAEDTSGADLQKQLVLAAGDMPFLGPNCYGFINYLDRVLLWPDQHGGLALDRGVAILTQSSNIAVNITMQQRALPLGVLVCTGNQAQTGMAEIGMTLLDDPRVTALGLHIEGINDIRAFEALAAKAALLQKPIVALKVGKSTQAQAATISHTASLAGGDAGAQALLDRLNIGRADDLPTFLETLKLLHHTGPLPSNRIASISCSGGEASLAADMVHDLDLELPALNPTQQTRLRTALGPMVALANPLDYHTYIWRDVAAMTAAWSAMMDPALALTFLIVDFPHKDRCDVSDWDYAVNAAIGAKQAAGGNLAMVSTLPENLPETVAANLADNGIVPLHGLREALKATEIAARLSGLKPATQSILLPTSSSNSVTRSEAQAKQALAAFGLCVPKSEQTKDPASVAEHIGYPVVLKGEGIAHKTEAGAVALGLQNRQDVEQAARKMPCNRFLIEEMIPNAVAELLIGVVKDPAHGFVLTLAAGGVLTELLADSCSLLIPASDTDVMAALNRLKIAKLLHGYRGATAADMVAVIRAVRAVQDYVIDQADGLEEIEINPLLCCPDRAVAADALLRRTP